jgi:F-type H+-transporting ATPase subunit b
VVRETRRLFEAEGEIRLADGSVAVTATASYLPVPEEKIKGMESAIDNAGKSVEEKNAAFEKAIRDARSKGLKEKEALVKQAEDEERRQIEAINSKALAELEEIRRKISADAERTRQALQPQVGAFAREITQKILGRTVS